MPMSISMSSVKTYTKNKKDKYKKEVIAITRPTNFQHVGHIGWDPRGGLDVNNVDMDNNWKVIYDFVEKQSGIEAVIKLIEKEAYSTGASPQPHSRGPLPPPSRGTPPPPPRPSRGSVPPPPPRLEAPPPPPSSRRGSPPPPPPVSGNKSGPPRPPPPSRGPSPPQSRGAPPPPLSRGSVPPPPSRMGAPPPPPPSRGSPPPSSGRAPPPPPPSRGSVPPPPPPSKGSVQPPPPRLGTRPPPPPSRRGGPPQPPPTGGGPPAPPPPPVPGAPLPFPPVMSGNRSGRPPPPASTTGWSSFHSPPLSPLPHEIIARGPDAQKAYRQALEEGELRIYRGRIMLIGQDRAGKTSLKKSLLGLSFDPYEPSTDGVNIDPSSFSVSVDDAIDWQISKDSDLKKDFQDGLVNKMAELLNQIREAQESEPTVPRTARPIKAQDKRPRFNEENVREQESEVEISESERKEKESISEASTKAENLEKRAITFFEPNNREDVIESHQSNAEKRYAGSTDINKEKTEVAEIEEQIDTREDVLSETVIENLIQRLSSKCLDSSAGQETTISVWDFAGQQLYYASHPVFFCHRAVYVLVYNLNKDLETKAEPCVRQGAHDIHLVNHDAQTNLEAIHSWLVSVHSARQEDDNGELKDRGQLPYLRPPVIIVGTHADCPFEEPNQMEAIIQKSISGKTYDKHVLRPFIRVDNTQSSNDGGVRTLREKIKKVFTMEPYMGEKVPLRWFKFEQVIKSLVEDEGKHQMPLKEIEELILKVCNIKDQKETSALLNFYHDLGVIVKHRNTIVLKAEWLIDVFRNLITIRPFNEQDPIHSNHWSTLEETGILHMDLVEHVFKEVIDRGETKDDILSMMEHYGLIARFGGSENPEDHRYFVPAQLNRSPERFLDIEPSTSDPCTLYLHFLDGFIPHGLYTCLVSKLITWCSEQGYPTKPQLYQSVSQFFIGHTYQHELFLILRKRFVKVVLKSIEKERSWIFQPVAFLIRQFLEISFHQLTEDCHWYQSLSYAISVRCPSRHACDRHLVEACNDDNCLHLLPIEEDQELVCRKSIGSESKPEVPGLKEWYREHPIVPSLCEELGGFSGELSVNPAFELSDEQKRWLVIGICLNKTLWTTLRDFLEPKMLALYSDLKVKHNIHIQVYSGRLTKDGKCNSLNYGSINNNEANHKKNVTLYDYRVNSAVDLGKLYLQTFMAKFSGFDDTCDLSAVLGILSSASILSPDVQDFSSKVRKDVRNDWGHCNFSDWDEAKFTNCFKLINSLVKALNLPADEDKKITDELNDWEKKGVEFCMGKISDADLVKFIEFSDAVLGRLTREVQHLSKRQDDEASRVRNALQSIRSDFEKYQDNINKKIESLERKFELHDKELKAIKKVIQPRCDP